ncbi:hypothetical protein B0H19DRAFT_1059971 [Mycena capillaripes]|nr:hypothetical protein B0H19DRAFT_1059971 [Mycena capillaripes]
MQAKFAFLSVVLSALFVSQLVVAVPGMVDCSTVRCASVKCPLGQTAQIKPGTCCPTCVPCGKVHCPLIAWLVLELVPTVSQALTLFIVLLVRLRYLATAARLALQIVPLFSVSPALKTPSQWSRRANAAPLASRSRIVKMSYVLSVSVRSNLAIAAQLADWERQFNVLALKW